VTSVILASASPRRRELLGALLDEFTVVPSDLPEEFAGAPEEDAVRLAQAKARAVAGSAGPGHAIIGCDTIVHDGCRAYGKPEDAADARHMLRELSGRQHRVVTGIALVRPGRAPRTAWSAATVTLATLSEAQIDAYVRSGRPLDKAGGYAIQDVDVPTVAGLDGCYCCVMGLPLWRLRAMLAAEGVACRRPDETFERCAACPEKPVRA
jgi:septum formation protein